MRWKRRRSIWPAAAALFGLLLLTLAGPRAWLRLQKQGTKRAEKATASTTQPPAADHTARSATPDVPLLPLVRPGATHLAPNPALATPTVAPLVDQDDYADDYAADYDDYTVVIDAPHPTFAEVEARQPPPMGGGLLGPLVAAPAAPVAWEGVQWDALLRARDALQGLLSAADTWRKAETERASQQATNRQPPQTTKTEIAGPRLAPQVRVDGPGDRLAMAPPREDSTAEVRTPSTDSTAPDEPSAIEPAELGQAQSPLAEESARTDGATADAPTARDAVLPETPQRLIEQLRALRQYPAARRWADGGLSLLEQVAARPAGAGTADLWTRLAELTEQGSQLATRQDDLALKTVWTRTTQALDRRLPLWQLLFNPQLSGDGAIVSRPAGSAADLIDPVRSVAHLTANSQTGAAWRKYLLLPELADLAQRGEQADRAKVRKTAQRVLSRMTDARLTPEQRVFLRSKPLVAMRRSLEPWAAGPVRLETLAAVMERYEVERSMRYGRAIAQFSMRLRWSGRPLYEQLAEHLDQAYRKANVRLAVTGELMNRLTPQPEPVAAPVRDRVGGADIRGRSHTSTKIAVELNPDPQRWRIALVARGSVRSQTYSDTWPARVRNAGRLLFEASKEIILGPDGVESQPTEAKVNGRNQLVAIESQLDPIPLLGSLARGVARTKHDRNRGPALAQVKGKVAREARQRMDRATDEKLDDLEDKFRAKVMLPLEQLAMNAEPVEMYTTDVRAVMRLRMAGEQQLGAHTLRPSAPSDSLMSLQMHESALNNALGGLGLEGQRMTALALHEMLSERLTGQITPPQADLPRRARVQFARSDAVRVAYDNDQVELILTIAELSNGRDRIRNFRVHAFFEPHVEGLRVDLVRTGTLHFSGPRLRTGPRVALHSVFSKLLTKSQRLPLVTEEVRSDPRLDGLMVTQLVIDDGWLAVALGPHHPQRLAWRSRLRVSGLR